ncbi:SDR family oxidoreductase [Candidatus Gottesmanbacteria bacterium]|nr:SDR family oxidoreductase [Candidatus Gottesmanbacteria bacterium]
MKKYIPVLDRFLLRGKTAVVTGGCGNLGPWFVQALLDVKAHVAIIDLPKRTIPSTLTLHSSSLLFYKGNITNPRQLKTIHKKILNELGPIDILVNNAGIDIPPQKIGIYMENRPHAKKMWDVNVSGAVNCINEFIADMKKKKKGSIINIGSLYGERSPNERFYTHLQFDKPWDYGATKAALMQVTRYFATRLAKWNIRINTLSPGGVFNNQDKTFIQKYSSRIPLSRMAQKETDLGGPLVFLASDASAYVTGTNLQVNGGFTAW